MTSTRLFRFAMIRSSIALGLLAFALPSLAQDDSEPMAVTWPDLAPRVEFEDPFAELEPETLMKLGIIARVRSLQERKPKSVSEGMAKEAKEAEVKLKKAGIDIEGLFARREEIKQKRMARATAVNEDLKDKTITLPGFLLPLEFEEKRVKEFLLVPWVGACIHTPPPPPNQIVNVTAQSPFESKSMFQSVSVTGKMTLKTASRKLFLVDGTSDIPTSYTIADAEVKPYMPNRKPERRGNPVHGK